MSKKPTWILSFYTNFSIEKKPNRGPSPLILLQTFFPFAEIPRAILLGIPTRIYDTRDVNPFIHPSTIRRTIHRPAFYNTHAFFDFPMLVSMLPSTHVAANTPNIPSVMTMGFLYPALQG